MSESSKAQCLPRRRLGQALEVSCLGLGCMGMSAFYNATSSVAEEESIGTIHAAIDAGCNFLDTSDIYGPFTNETLVGKAIKKYARDDVVIATKFGLVLDETTGAMKLDGSRQHVRVACEASLARLQVETIDLYYLHRRDPATPITETIAEMKALVEEGKVKAIGVSECSIADIRAAHAVFPLTAVQLEWSLWTRDCEAEIVPVCRELGIGIVAYSPLGRDFLTGSIKSVADLAEGDWRRTQPRFEGEALARNVALVDKVKEFAAIKGCTPGQLALAWVLHQGDDVVPIPGTRRVKYLRENLAAARMKLSRHEMAVLEEALPASKVVGQRYAAMGTTFHYGDRSSS